MAYETRNNSGSVFNNDKKKADNHPDRTGQAVIDGKAYWVSGWIKQDRNGKPYLSLAFKPKDEKPQQQQRSYADERPAPMSRRVNPPNPDDEFVPF